MSFNPVDDHTPESEPESDDSPPDPGELHALAADLNYEIWMFWYLCRIAIPSSSGPQQNAFKEAMLIHARCLMDFFNSQPRKDDVVAAHYAPDWDAAKDGGEELAWLNEHLEIFINKRVAHITAYRQRTPKESHLIETVQNHVTNLLERFLAKVPDDMEARLRGLPKARS